MSADGVGVVAHAGMDYRKQRRERQLAAIAATSVDLDDEDLGATELRALMKEARRANALRRAAGS